MMSLRIILFFGCSKPLNRGQIFLQLNDACVSSPGELTKKTGPSWPVSLLAPCTLELARRQLSDHMHGVQIFASTSLWSLSSIQFWDVCEITLIHFLDNLSPWCWIVVPVRSSGARACLLPPNGVIFHSCELT
jgi:hypothetical protein